jgi:Leucine-rich repeat (LRR) protein
MISGVVNASVSAYNTTNCTGAISQNEYNSLQALYQSTQGTNWKWYQPGTIWSFPSSLTAPCSDTWQGISCNKTVSSLNCSIVALDLRSCNLNGPLPTEIGFLKDILSLYLDGNNLTYSIPSEVGSLIALEQLSFGDNCLTGKIPTELGQLLSLRVLLTSNNSLTGYIPKEISLLSMLETCNISHNMFSGQIPTEISHLAGLELLYLSTNRLTGPIPSELGLLRSLKQLFVDVNHLSGSLSSELGSLSLLEWLGVDVNSLHGSIPTELGLLSFLTAAFLDYCGLNGSIPVELGYLSSIKFLYLDLNCLTGQIPTELGRLSNMQVLGLYDNYLSGSIPTQLGQMSALQEMLLFENSLTNTIPTQLGQLNEITELQLYGNSLSQYLPTELGATTLLQIMWLQSNLLSGKIPSEFGYLSRLQQLTLQTNSIDGPIPIELGFLQSMEILNLGQNQLTGTLPTELGRLRNVSTAAFNSNRITGQVPTELGNLSSLQIFDISENCFSGGIPTELGASRTITTLVLNSNLLTTGLSVVSTITTLLGINISNNLFYSEVAVLPSRLQFIDASSNYLTGSLENSMKNCLDLQFISVASNFFSSSIPSYFSLLTALQALNLSANSFTGGVYAVSGEACNSSLQSIDLSNNTFSGTLPPSFFTQPVLQKVLLFSNCFSGQLPADMCSNSQLETLFLDDLTGRCGSQVPLIFQQVMKGVFPKKLMTGMIPSCLWAMSTLQVLQLSGNGFTGTLNNINTNSSSLRIMLLASNKLSGQIPRTFQTYGRFEQLDLSNNKLAGTLAPELHTSPLATVFDLTVNRLSGRLPQGLYNATVVNVLDGNLFQCQVNNIPLHDPNNEDYICGSGGFDLAMELAAAMVTASMILTFVLHRHNDLLVRVVNADTRFLPSVRSYTAFVVIIGFLQLMFAMAAFVVLKTTPSLGMFLTHSEQYLWTTTVAFMHGWAPLLVVFVIIVPSLSSIWTWEEVFLVDSHLDSSSSAAAPDKFRSANERLRRFGSAGLLHVGNVLVVVLINGLYVDAVLKGVSENHLLIIEMFLGCFKLTWNSLAIPGLVYLVFGTNNLSHRVVMSLFNFVGGPFISTFLSSSNCFRNVFTGETPVQSSSSVSKFTCETVCSMVCTSDDCYELCPLDCGPFGSQPVDVIMTPPWMYSYQCSSSLTVNYVPVLVLSFAFSSLAGPVIWIIRSRLSRQHNKYKFINHLSKRLTFSIQDDDDESESFARDRKGTPLVDGADVRMKFMLNISVLLTFGIASPLLAIIIVGETAVYCVFLHFSVGKYAEVARSRSEDCYALFLCRLELSKLPTLSNEFLIIFSFVGVFWCLFVFDMIGDVYGNFVGYCMLLVPLLLPTPFLFRRCGLVISPDPFAAAIVDRTKTLGIELVARLPASSVVDNPQITADEYLTNIT